MAQSAAIAWRLGLWILLGFAVAVAAGAAQAAGRVALVIGNGNYENLPRLAQPANDAADVAEELRKLGFEVTAGSDVTRDQFLLMVSDFRSQIKFGKAEDVVFYYSGHAFNMFGLNQLVPVDAQLKNRDQLQLETIRLNDIISQIQVSDTQKTVFLLDASRQSPLPEALKSDSLGEGLAQIETNNETASALLIFANLPNLAAPASAGRNSAFTSALLKHMATRGKNIDAIFPRIRKDVIAATHNKQKPFKQGSPPELFFFNKGPGKTQPEIAEPPPETDSVPDKKVTKTADSNTVVDPVDSDELDVIQGIETGNPHDGSTPPVTDQPVTDQPVGDQPVTDPAVTDPPATETTVNAEGVFQDCEAQCPLMVKIGGGTFKMGHDGGDASHQPVRNVTVGDFALGQREVSIGEWRKCVADGKCRDPGKAQADHSDDVPVLNLTWNDALSYAEWLSGVTGKRYRLPSEAEWEYAARAGTSFAYSGSNDPVPEYMDCKTCGSVAKHPFPRSADLKPNNFGLSGMSGGAAEWVQDCWTPNYANHPGDARAVEADNCAKRVLRGGSWRDEARNVTVYSRAYYDFDVAYPNNGFRIARDLP